MPQRRRHSLRSTPELHPGRGLALLVVAVAASLGGAGCLPATDNATDAGAGSGGRSNAGSGGNANPGSGGLSSTGGSANPGSGGASNTGSGGRTGTGGNTASGGNAASGGTTATGGTTGSGGATGTGGRGGTGGTATGGMGTGGRANTGGAGGVIVINKAFSQCRFHFGTIDTIAKNNTAIIPQLDFFTPGWMGQADTFNMKSVCDEANGQFAGKVPVIVSYTAAFFAKRRANLKDCNAGGGQQDLCTAGAANIQQNLSTIVGIYENYAQGFAGCYGTSKPIIFLMEPDFYQYTGSSQTQPWSPALAGQIMSQFVNAMKKHLPNAIFSMDISPWVAPNNGSDNGASWFANFDMSLFTFINTSGGGTDGGSAKIRAANMMTWAGVSAATGKPIMADTGYGVNGASAGPDPVWDTVANINARIDDGVVSISQYNPASSWGSTISGIRSQIKALRFCP